MNSDKKTSANPPASMPALKIGSLVRCTDDGVEGRIVWANAVAVKVRWDDGEQITWRRDSLADRPIEILDAAGDEDQHEVTDAPEQPVAKQPVDPAATAPVPAEPHFDPPPAEPTEEPGAVAPEPTPAANTQTEDVSPSESPQQAQEAPEQMGVQPETTSSAIKPTGTPKAKQAVDGGKEKRLSALDAAAKVLDEIGRAMTCQELIAVMSAKGYWSSPGSKTPQATLYSAILREIATKGTDSRFRKAERGRFAVATRL